MKLLSSLALSALLLVSGSPQNEAQTAIDDRVKAAIESPERLEKDLRFDARRRPDIILSLLDLKPGMAVLDIFAGPGYYTELLSALVGPKGRVIYQSNALYDEILAVALRMRFKDGRLANVDRRTTELDDLTIAPQSVDRVLMALTYHDFYFDNSRWPGIDEKAVLAHLYAGLKPGGRIVLVDHYALEGTGTSEAGRLHRIEKSVVVNDFKAAGFQLVGENDSLRNLSDIRTQSVFNPAIRGKTDRFILVFEKPL